MTRAIVSACLASLVAVACAADPGPPGDPATSEDSARQEPLAAPEMPRPHPPSAPPATPPSAPVGPTDAPADTVRADHPLLGLWRLPYPGSTCWEIYRIAPDGTTQVTSAEEEAETVYTVSDRPSERGFYTWVDRIVRDNGGKDCGGNVTHPGPERTRYVLMLPSAKVFVLCANESEELETCIGPFLRIEPVDGDV
mgnify:CR=1 FL=1